MEVCELKRSPRNTKRRHTRGREPDGLEPRTYRSFFLCLLRVRVGGGAFEPPPEETIYERNCSGTRPKSKDKKTTEEGRRKDMSRARSRSFSELQCARSPLPWSDLSAPSTSAWSLVVSWHACSWADSVFSTRVVKAARSFRIFWAVLSAQEEKQEQAVGVVFRGGYMGGGGGGGSGCAHEAQQTNNKMRRRRKKRNKCRCRTGMLQSVYVAVVSPVVDHDTCRCAGYCSLAIKTYVLLCACT